MERSMTTVEIDSGYISGPDYYREPEFVNMARILRKRTCNEQSLKKNLATAKRMLRVLNEDLGITDLHQVDEEVIRRMYEVLRQYQGERTAKGNLAQFGAFILANTGHNPYSGAFGTNRKTLDDVVEMYSKRCRYPQLLHDYAKDMKKRGLKDLTVQHNVMLVAFATEGLDRLYGDSWTIETVGQDEMLGLRFNLEMEERSAKQTIEAFIRFVRFATGRAPLRANLLWNCSDDFAPNRVFISSEQWKSLMDDLTPEMRLIFMLGGLMGLRRNEMVSILLEDIDGDRLKIRGKGHGEGKIVTMKMPEPVIEAIEAYKVERAKVIDAYGDNSQGHLFIQMWKGRGCPMAASEVTRRVGDYGKVHGIKVTPHSLRRLYAMTIHEAGVDDDTLRRMMRHTNIQTTMICYLRANPDLIEDAQDALETALLG